MMHSKNTIKQTEPRASASAPRSTPNEHGLHKHLKSAGLGLPELLISIFLSSVLITALLQGYLIHKKNHLKVQESFEKQYDLNWVSDLLRDSVRQAGFTPCLPLNQLMIKDTRQSSSGIKDLVIEKTPEVLLKIHYMNSNFSKLQLIKNNRQLILQKNVLINPQNPVIIADCFHAEVHTLDSSRFSGKSLSLRQPLVFEYPDEVYVGEWMEDIWQLRSEANKKHTLFYKSQRLEQLSTRITQFAITIQLLRDQKIVSIHLGLEESEQEIIILARNA